MARGRSKRGFGAMPKEEVRKIARKGGHSHSGNQYTNQ